VHFDGEIDRERHLFAACLLRGTQASPLIRDLDLNLYSVVPLVFISLTLEFVVGAKSHLGSLTSDSTLEKAQSRVWNIRVILMDLL
jgi:hypothetical protein